MRWFSISGTASRKDALVVAAVTFVLSAAVLLLSASARLWGLVPWIAPLAGIAWAALIATLIRRLHDIGRNGAWVLILLLTLPWIGGLGILWLIWQRPSKRSHQSSLIGAICGGTLVGLVLVLALASVFWRPFTLETAEMKPTLLIGDRLLVRHGGAEGLERGDLVLIRAPADEAQAIFRVIGLAGDRIAMQDGRVAINGTPVPQRAAKAFAETYQPQGPRHLLPRCRKEVGLGGLCEADRWIETLPGGHRHAVLDYQTRGGPPDTIAETVVPEGSVYLMGDNRDAALDSRFAVAAGGLGPVTLDRIVGRVDLILFSSLANRPMYLWSWRPGRLLARIDRIEAE